MTHSIFSRQIVWVILPAIFLFGGMCANAKAEPYQGNTIPIWMLFGSEKSMSLTEALHRGIQWYEQTNPPRNSAEENNLGVFRSQDGFGVATLEPIGNGVPFNLGNIGLGNGGWGKASGDADAFLGNIKPGIFFHTNAYFTLDLDEIRLAGEISRPEEMRFTTLAGINGGLNDPNMTASGGLVHMGIIVWGTDNLPMAGYFNGVDVGVEWDNGAWRLNEAKVNEVKNTFGLISQGNLAQFDFAVPTNARYLTFVSSEGNNDTGWDHLTLAGAQLSFVHENGILLNQLFGSRSNTPKYPLNYSHAFNTGETADASDFGIEKVQRGDLASWRQIPLTADDNGIKFVLNDQLGSSDHQDGNIRSNLCSNDNDSLFFIDGNIYEGGIGMHANTMITFDLGALRDANGWTDDMTFQFSSTVGGTHVLTDNQIDGNNWMKMHSLVLLSSADEVLRAFLGGREVNVKLDNGAWTLDFGGIGDLSSFLDDVLIRGANTADIFAEFGSEVDYLSLFILSNGSPDFDHAAYFNPLLTAISPAENGSDTPEPATWGILLVGLAAVGILRRKGRK